MESFGYDVTLLQTTATLVQSQGARGPKSNGKRDSTRKHIVYQRANDDVQGVAGSGTTSHRWVSRDKTSSELDRRHMLPRKQRKTR